MFELNEKCGIFGIYSNNNDIARTVYYGLWALQHRGQENSGIASSTGKRIYSHKGQGLVAHVYDESDIKKLKGHIAIGHNRYSTFGKSDIDHSQPVYYQNNTIALAHNGNIPVVKEMKKFLTQNGITTNGLNDSEMMYKTIENWVVKGYSLKDAMTISFPLFTGAFSMLIMGKNELAAIRDKYGIRPLCIGKLKDSYVFSSETCALDTVGATFIREVNPGELVIANKNGLKSYQLDEGSENLDVFEFIYFARPDSQLMGKSIYDVRKNLGRKLAEETKLKADIVIPIPDSATPSAIGYSQASGTPFELALTKNRYIHRTFIKPSTHQRISSVKMKLNLIPELIKGKSVVLVDDSIVRGTTSKHLADLVRSAGPKEIHLLITSPPVLYPDFYGIDTPKQNSLIAANKSKKELREYIGVDSLHYLSYKGMLDAIGIDESKLCTACLNGNYPINIGVNLKKIKFVKV